MNLYLDANATTPLHSRVREAFIEALDRFHANPASSHRAGSQARAKIEDVRAMLERSVGGGHTAVFTSGGTEANNLALWSLAKEANDLGRRHMVVSGIEHPAVGRMMGWISRLLKMALGVVPPNHDGSIPVERLVGAIRPDTGLVAVMHANNETGRIQPVEQIAAVCRDLEVFFHGDTVQSWGKSDVLPVAKLFDSFTLSAHKIEGPKGAGVAFLRKGPPIHPLLQGGAQESGARSGTPNVPAIVALSEAFHRAVLERTPAEYDRQRALRERLWEGVRLVRPDAVRHCPNEPCLVNTLSVALPGVAADMLVIAMDLRGVALSTGSACASGTARPSPVLEAMGVPKELLKSSVRISFLPDFREADVERFTRELSETLADLGAGR